MRRITGISALKNTPVLRGQSCSHYPARRLVDTPVDIPVGALVESPDGALVDTPVDTPVGALVDTPVSALVGTPVSALVLYTPVDSPVGALVDTPVDIPLAIWWTLQSTIQLVHWLTLQSAH